MKFSVKRTLKASALSFMGGTIGPGIYDTETPNFAPEIKEVLIAEMDDPRGLVECLDPEDHNILEPELELKDVSSEVLDDLSSGEGEAEENQPPLGAQSETSAVETSAPPLPKRKSTPRKLTIKK